MVTEIASTGDGVSDFGYESLGSSLISESSNTLILLVRRP